MDVKLNTAELLEIAKKVVGKHSGELSGEVSITLHGLKLTAEYFFDDMEDSPPELGISDVSCADEDVFVSFKEEDERMAMAIAELSSFRG